MTTDKKWNRFTGGFACCPGCLQDGAVAKRDRHWWLIARLRSMTLLQRGSRCPTMRVGWAVISSHCKY